MRLSHAVLCSFQRLGVLKSECAQPYVLNLASYAPTSGAMDLSKAGDC
jgi:hypothetical protein